MNTLAFIRRVGGSKHLRLSPTSLKISMRKYDEKCQLFLLKSSSPTNLFWEIILEDVPRGFYGRHCLRSCGHHNMDTFPACNALFTNLPIVGIFQLQPLVTLCSLGRPRRLKTEPCLIDETVPEPRLGIDNEAWTLLFHTVPNKCFLIVLTGLVIQ